MRRLTRLLILALGVANPLMGRVLGLCLENAARLDKDTLKVFRTELGRVLSASNRQAAFDACGPGSLTITFQIAPPAKSRQLSAQFGNETDSSFLKLRCSFPPRQRSLGVACPGYWDAPWPVSPPTNSDTGSAKARLTCPEGS